LKGGRVTLRVRDTGPLHILKNVQLDLDVGLMPEDADVRHEGTDLSVGTVALINEFGSTAAKIPARPVFRTWAAQHAVRFRDQIIQTTLGMIRTQKFQPGPFERLALAAQRSLKSVIASGRIKPKNAPSTLERKAPETRPLVETKQLLQAIGARIRSKRGLVSWNFSTRGKG
jgi:hypothetical protein